jgi:hypothetical protein
MRLRWLVAIVLITLIAPQAPVRGAGWVTFRHPDPPFAITYPSEWVRISADKLTLLVLVAPSSRGLGMVVVAVPVKPGENVDDLVPELPRIIPRSFTEYRPLRTDRTTLGGRPTIVHYFTGVRNNQRVYVMLGALTSSNYGFLLYGTTALDSPQLREELTLLQQIIVRFHPGR